MRLYNLKLPGKGKLSDWQEISIAHCLQDSEEVST